MPVEERAVDAVPAVSPGQSGSVRARAARWTAVAAPALVWLVVRVIGLVVLARQADVDGHSLVSRLTRWDGQWLLGIAGGGYSGVPLGLVDAHGHRGTATALAFFPGYPATVSVVRFVAGVDLVTAGLVVAAVAGIVLAHGLARLGELVPGGSRRAGLVLVALVAAAPMGVVWTMTYSEGLFGAAAVWALVALLRGEWVLAGWCTALAGLVRPTGFALVGAVGLALLGVLAGRRERGVAGGAEVSGVPGGRVSGAAGGRVSGAAGGRVRAAVGLGLAPLGVLGYLGFVAARMGSALGWFVLQRRGWNSRFDAGRATLRFTGDVLATGRSVLEVVTVAVLVGALVLLVLCVRLRVPWPLWVYAAGVLVMDLGSNGLMGSKARLLLPAFPLLVPVALGLSRRRPGTICAVLAAAALASAWFGAYALTGWRYAI